MVSSGYRSCNIYSSEVQIKQFARNCHLTWTIEIHLLLYSFKNVVRKVNQIKRKVIATNSFLIGDFIFILNIDWIPKFSFYKQSLLSIANVLLFNDLYYLTNLVLDHVFHTNIIAYCQQNWYVRLAICSDIGITCFEYNMV